MWLEILKVISFIYHSCLINSLNCCSCSKKISTGADAQKLGNPLQRICVDSKRNLFVYRIAQFFLAIFQITFNNCNYSHIPTLDRYIFLLIVALIDDSETQSAISQHQESRQWIERKSKSKNWILTNKWNSSFGKVIALPPVAHASDYEVGASILYQ